MFLFEGIRGAVATREIKAGDVIVKAPRDCVLMVSEFDTYVEYYSVYCSVFCMCCNVLQCVAV